MPLERRHIQMPPLAADLVFDPILKTGWDNLAEMSECFRRKHDDDLVELPAACRSIERGNHTLNEYVFMPLVAAVTGRDMRNMGPRLVFGTSGRIARRFQCTRRYAREAKRNSVNGIKLRRSAVAHGEPSCLAFHGHATLFGVVGIP